MLILNISHIGFLAGADTAAEFMELASILFLFITAVYVVKNLSIEYILLRVARELEVALEERTRELQQKSDRLLKTEVERKRLEELNRFKSQFVSLIAHEFRTPLTSLQGFSELLVNMEMDRESQKRWGQIILEESQRLGRLVNDILDLSSIETGHLKIKEGKFSLHRILKKEIERFRISSTRYTYREEIPEHLPDVYGDKNRIFQVLTNLIDNATKYSPEGSEVIVRAVTENGVVKVGITDKGYGIPEDLFEKIFEPFYRADMPKFVEICGTGLGLSISKNIIEMHGGDIWVESKVGKGSTFYFTIPVVIDD